MEITMQQQNLASCPQEWLLVYLVDDPELDLKIGTSVLTDEWFMRSASDGQLEICLSSSEVSITSLQPYVSTTSTSEIICKEVV
jgi:hypothetical protein